MDTTYARRLPEQDTLILVGQIRPQAPGYPLPMRPGREPAQLLRSRNPAPAHGGGRADRDVGHRCWKPSCFLYGLVQSYRRQNVFDVLSAAFQPFRQLERLAQLFRRFVNREAWRIGSQFEQHASRFTKIDGMKVTAIDH